MVAELELNSINEPPPDMIEEEIRLITKRISKNLNHITQPNVW